MAPLSEPAIPARTPADATTAPPSPSASGAKEAAPTYSTTNVQEEGVDEPDVVKTDGVTIFTVVGQTLYAVAASGPGAPRIVGSLALSRVRRRPAAARPAPAGDPEREPDRGRAAWPARALAPKIAATEPDAHHRGRRRRPGGPEGGPHAHARRPVRQRAPERRDRARRALLDAAGLRGGRACAAARRAGCRARASPRGSPGAIAPGRSSPAARCAGRRRSRGSGWSRSSPSTSTRACGRSTPTRS